MKRRLPKGEETLPFCDLDGKMLTLSESRKLTKPPITEELLIKRMKIRISQGRVFTIYRFGYELSPDSQLKRMELRDEIGLGLIEAERKLLVEELRILEG